MFVGHLAVALVAKRAAPTVNLGWLMAGVTALDLIWPVFVLAGIEHVRVVQGATAFTPLIFDSYPWSHSLVMAVVWGLALVAIARSRRVIAPAGLLVGLVVSHWVLDFVTHRPDMPIYPGSSKLGLGLWNSIPGTLIVELVLYAAGLWIYLRATEARDRIGRWGFLALAVFLVVVYVAFIGLVPPSIQNLYISALAGIILLTVWSWWADRHRMPRRAA